MCSNQSTPEHRKFCIIKCPRTIILERIGIIRIFTKRQNFNYKEGYLGHYSWMMTMEIMHFILRTISYCNFILCFSIRLPRAIVSYQVLNCWLGTVIPPDSGTFLLHFSYMVPCSTLVTFTISLTCELVNLVSCNMVSKC